MNSAEISANLRQDDFEGLVDDILHEEGGLDRGELSCSTVINDRPWGSIYDRYTRAIPSEALCRDINPGRLPGAARDQEDFKQFNLVLFQTVNGSAKELYIRGIMHNIPAQEGVHGWARISAIAWYVDITPPQPVEATNTNGDGNGNDNDDDVSMTSSEIEEHDNNPPLQDEDFVLEGVVLPGGKIIVGRWWMAAEDLDRAADGGYADEAALRVRRGELDTMTEVGPFLWWREG